MKPFLKIVDKAADVSGYLAGWLVPIMVLLVAFEVFMRYVLHNPPMVADEFSAYMLVALSYVGLAYTWQQGGHIRITLLVNNLPPKVAVWTRFIGLILVFIFMIGMTQSTYKMITYALKINLRSDTWLTIPLFWPQLTVFFGVLLLLLTILADILRVFKSIAAGETVEEPSK